MIPDSTDFIDLGVLNEDICPVDIHTAARHAYKVGAAFAKLTTPQGGEVYVRAAHLEPVAPSPIAPMPKLNCTAFAATGYGLN